MAHKKGVGSTDNGRDSNPKFLGVKLFGGEAAISGNIIVRQRGTKYHPGENVGLGKDFTIYSLAEGTVRFHKGRKNRTYVSVDPFVDPFADYKAPPKKKAATVAPKVEEVAQQVEAQIDDSEAKAAEAKAKADAAAAKAAAEKAKKDAEAKAAAEAEKAEAPVEAAPVDVEATKSELYSKIGTADASEADDLKKIKGVGPKLEGVLNDMGIYTFEQVSKMGDREYDLVDSMLTAFQGRGKRDEWHVQAAELKG